MKLSIPESKLNSEGRGGVGEEGEGKKKTERTGEKRGENWMGKCLGETGLNSERNIWIRNQIQARMERQSKLQPIS